MEPTRSALTPNAAPAPARTTTADRLAPRGAAAGAPIAARLAGCRFGTVVTHGRLSVVPLHADEHDDGGEAPYLLLDDALAEGKVVVTEVSSAGSVPELALANLAGLPVLLLDGEELVGAKQNRILNLSVLAPSLGVTKIPVSCVEAGRWSSVSARFASGARTHFASGRARKAADVSASLRNQGHRRGDQGEVWRGIAEKSARMGVRSATQAAAAIYEDRHDALEGSVRAIGAARGQCGAVFVIDGRVAGIDLFDRPRTFAKALPKLVRGYALDALDASAGDTSGRGGDAIDREVVRFLQRIAAAAATAHAAVGEGEDWRLDDGAVAGGALVAEGRVVHLCAFPVLDTSSPKVGRAAESM